MTEKTFRTIAKYQLEYEGNITTHQGELTLTLPGDAVDAAQIAIEAVRTAAEAGRVTNLQISVALDHEGGRDVCGLSLNTLELDESVETLDKAIDKMMAAYSRFSIQFKIQMGAVGIVYPSKSKDFYFDLSRRGLIHIGRLWIDW